MWIFRESVSADFANDTVVHAVDMRGSIHRQVNSECMEACGKVAGCLGHSAIARRTRAVS